MSATFAALGSRAYRLYFAGGAVSNIGSWVQRVAQDWLVLQISGSASSLGITTGLQFLPFLLFSPIGGTIADRFPKRRVLQCTQITMFTLALTLGLLTISGNVTVWLVYVLAFLFGTAGALDAPARQSFPVEMVGPEHLTNAIGLNSASFNAARLIGPGLAGFLIVAIGTGPTIASNAICYIGTFVALQVMRPADLQPQEAAPRTPGMFREGLKYLRGRPHLLLVLAIAGITGAFGFNFQMTSALMATEVFGKGAGEYGILGSVLAIGSLTGALLAARRGKPRGRLIVCSAVLFGAVELLSGLMPTYLTFALTLPLVGLFSLTMINAANATMQLSVSPAMRGRVMAVYLMVFQGSTPIGSPIIGWVGDALGARWTLILGGGVSLLGAVTAALVLAHAKKLVVRAHVLPRPHLHVFSEPAYDARRAELATPAGRISAGSLSRLLTGGDRYLAAVRSTAAARPVAVKTRTHPASRPPMRDRPPTRRRRVAA